MNSQTSDEAARNTCWGESLRIPRSETWILVTEIFQTRPVWRQVPFTLQEDQKSPLDLESEVSVIMKSLMEGLQTRVATDLGDYLGPQMISAATQGTTPDLSVGMEQVASMFKASVDPVILEALSEHFAGPLATRILEDVKACLSVLPERVPLNLRPEGQRGERFAGRQEPRRRLNKVSRNGHPSGLAETEIAQTVVGRVVWDPMLMPILLRKADLPYPVGNPQTLSLQRIEWPVGGQEVNLTPIPWYRLDLADPFIHPLGALPLEALPDPLTCEAIAELVDGAAKGSPLEGALIALMDSLEACPDMAWWTLADLFGPYPEKTQTPA